MTSKMGGSFVKQTYNSCTVKNGNNKTLQSIGLYSCKKKKLHFSTFEFNVTGFYIVQEAKGKKLRLLMIKYLKRSI